MSESIPKAFSKAEIEAMRRAAQSEDGSHEDGLKRRFWNKLKKVGQKLPFAEELLAAYYCAIDPKTPNKVKIILLGAIAYFVFPTDAIADFLPLIGFADDAAVLATAITQVAGSIRDEHRAKAREVLGAKG